MLPAAKTLKMKVCLVGEEGVGKTSLVQRYVLSQFDERYLRTVGTMVRKKTIDLTGPDGEAITLQLMVWDIMGRRDFMSLYREAYFSRARGILAVCDLTRPETLDALNDWLEAIHTSVGDVPAIILGNKKDMADRVRITEGDLAALCEPRGAPSLLTSAKTGENVETAFRKLADMALRARPPAAEAEAAA